MAAGGPVADPWREGLGVMGYSSSSLRLGEVLGRTWEDVRALLGSPQTYFW